METSNFKLRTSNSGTVLGVALIRGYQLLLGPFVGGACRFHPSCSQYAAEAIVVHVTMPQVEAEPAAAPVAEAAERAEPERIVP